MQRPGSQVSRQIEIGNRTEAALFRDTGPSVRFLAMHGFATAPASTAVTVVLLRAVTRPHWIRTFQPVMNIGNGLDISCDILLSSNVAVDTGAEVRDRHLSGGRLATDGWSASNIATQWPINIKISSWFTQYKLAMRNLHTGSVLFDINLTVELI